MYWNHDTKAILPITVDQWTSLEQLLLPQNPNPAIMAIITKPILQVFVNLQKIHQTDRSADKPTDRRTKRDVDDLFPDLKIIKKFTVLQFS